MKKQAATLALVTALGYATLETRAGGSASPEQAGSGETRVGWIEGNTFSKRRVTFTDVDGRAMFQGDIILGRTEDVIVEPDQRTTPYGSTVVGERFRWPNGIVPFVLDPTLSPTMLGRIAEAIEHWEETTPIRLVELNSGNANQFADWVQFTAHDSECSSFVGRQGTGMQNINLQPACSTGAVIHEIGHAVGLWHEQSRANRDEFVDIMWENIQAGPDDECNTGDEDDQCHNFDKHAADGEDIGGYDYDSIMHYGARAFSKNGEETILPRDPNASIGQRSGLSQGDIVAVRSMYGQRFDNEAGHRRYDSTGSYFFPNGFQPLGTQFSGHPWLTGDFDGDGRDDIAQIYYPRGRAKVFIYTSAGTVLSVRAHYLGARLLSAQHWKSGDFNNDGLDDLVLVYGNATQGATAWIYSSTGDGFMKSHQQRLGAGYWESQRWETGDFNGDGLDDLVLLYGHSKHGATAWLYSSDGTGFSKSHSQRLQAGFWQSQEWQTGDFNGDGLDDLVLVYGHSTHGATAWIYSANGTGFTRTRTQRMDAEFWEAQHWQTGDFDGDGLDDLALVYGSRDHGATTWTYSSDGYGLVRSAKRRMGIAFSTRQVWLAADLDGDGRAGLSLLE